LFAVCFYPIGSFFAMDKVFSLSRQAILADITPYE